MQPPDPPTGSRRPSSTSTRVPTANEPSGQPQAATSRPVAPTRRGGPAAGARNVTMRAMSTRRQSIGDPEHNTTSQAAALNSRVVTSSSTPRARGQGDQTTSAANLQARNIIRPGEPGEGPSLRSRPSYSSFFQTPTPTLGQPTPGSAAAGRTSDLEGPVTAVLRHAPSWADIASHGAAISTSRPP